MGESNDRRTLNQITLSAEGLDVEGLREEWEDLNAAPHDVTISGVLCSTPTLFDQLATALAKGGEPALHYLDVMPADGWARAYVQINRPWHWLTRHDMPHWGKWRFVWFEGRLRGQTIEINKTQHLSGNIDKQHADTILPRYMTPHEARMWWVSRSHPQP